jgi:hypothetical protein
MFASYAMGNSRTIDWLQKRTVNIFIAPFVGTMKFIQQIKRKDKSLSITSRNLGLYIKGR